jgi:hypothetical protein
MNAVVSIAPACSDALTLDVWNALSDGERLQLADHLTDRLSEHGWQIDEVPALRRCGPVGEEQPVLQWREAKTGLTFSLIPGGTFRPGYSEAKLVQFDRVFRALQDGDFDPELRDEEEEEAEEEEWVTAEEELAAHTFSFYHGGVPCHVGPKAEMRVGAFLLTCEPLTLSVPGIEGQLDSSFSRLLDVIASRVPEERPHIFLDVNGVEAEAILEDYGWALPTSAEFEWALRGGREALFYWGDAVPRWLAEYQGAVQLLPAELITAEVSHDDLMRMSLTPSMSHAWPRCNRYGLAGLLGRATWCAPDPDAEANVSSITRGGAASCFPWQYCREWMLLLNATETRCPHPPPASKRACLRPVVRLEADAGVRFAV